MCDITLSEKNGSQRSGQRIAWFENGQFHHRLGVLVHCLHACDVQVLHPSRFTPFSEARDDANASGQSLAQTLGTNSLLYALLLITLLCHNVPT